MLLTFIEPLSSKGERKKFTTASMFKDYVMRLDAIKKLRTHSEDAIEALSPKDCSEYVTHIAAPQRLENLKNVVKTVVSIPALQLQQTALRKRLACEIFFPYNLLCMEERYAREASLLNLRRISHAHPPHKVLLVGCSYGGKDAAFWAKQKQTKQLAAIDIYRFSQYWEKSKAELEQQYGCGVEFQQATLESLPYPDGAFDLVTSSAVLEHVRNFELGIRESARVLAPGGFAWQRFGPLYFCHGGDHCINSYGNEHGYDHVLLDEADYRQTINNQAFFNTQTDPNCNYWAKTDLFSFLEGKQYIQIFQKYFKIRHVLIQLSEQSFFFRDTYPDKWRQMLESGVPEEDLHIKGISIILQKPL